MALDILFDIDDAPVQVASDAGAIDLAREANHRIANVLSLIASGVRLQATNAARKKGLTGDEVRLLLATIAAQIDAAGQLHKWLCNGAGDTETELGDYLRRLCTGLEPFASVAGPLKLTCQIKGSCMVRADQFLPLALIVCEMVANAIKYAHPAGAPGIVIVYGSGDENFTMIEVADDGVGLPEAFDPKVDGGLGLQLVRSLAKQLGATLVFDSDPLGLRFQLFLPKRVAKPDH
jgi:two-component sensor histidine kinase